MSKISSKGTCQFCQGVFSKAAMTKHVELKYQILLSNEMVNFTTVLLDYSTYN